MRSVSVVIVFTLLVLCLPVFQGNSYTDLQVRKAFLVKKHLKRLKKQEGAIKLVGGRAEFEGKIKIVEKVCALKALLYA